MGGLSINIHNKCRSNKRCKCSGSKSHVSVRTGTVKGTDFGYCTHEIDSKRTRDLKISTVFWQNVELERIGFSSLFETAYSVTVFFQNTHDGKRNLIKKPLLIRVRDTSRKYHWFENIGGYANKRWWRIDEEASSRGYPENDNYSGDNVTFLDKLKSATCRLFIAHRIHIDFDKEDKYDIKCEICGENFKIEVQQENVSKAPGYKKYNHSATFSENSILVYKGRQLTFQKRTRVKTGYYLPIPVDHENVNKVSAYYWDGDTQRDNPLLIEFVSVSNVNRWIENISIPDKYGHSRHDKWKALSWMDHNPPELKKRLDTLNCIYNGVIKINIGNQKVCHDIKHIMHYNRLNHFYDEAKGTYPVLYTYKYWSTMGTEHPLNISEINIGDQPQDFKGLLPFRNVTRFTVYVSPCDKEKPFLICVESGRRKDYKWYKRGNENNWENNFILDQKSPSRAKTEIVQLFGEIKDKLDIGRCHVSTKVDGVKLEMTKTVDEGKYFTQYKYNYTQDRKDVTIFVNKSTEGLISGFFKNAHKVATTSETFVVSRDLQSGGKIGSGTSGKIEGVETVYAYFWDGEPKEPILVGVRKCDEHDPMYYGKNGNSVTLTWMSSQVSGMNEQQALDYQNCKLNNAIPIELTEPTNLTRFSSTNKPSSCLKGNLVRSDKSPDLPSGAKNAYEVKAYKINDKNRISRVTYGGKATDIRPPYTQYGPTLNVYSWIMKPYVPLLVEFKKSSGGSNWYENLGKGPEYREWEHVNGTLSKEFYDDKNWDKLTEKFTDKLNEANCRINGVVQLDISQTGSKYCHGLYSGHERRIKVTPLPNGNPFKGYTGYEHTSVSQNTFTISSLYYGALRQEIVGSRMFPIQEISKVLVYFPVCSGASPIAIRVEESGGMEKWLKRAIDTNKWEEATYEFTGKDNQDIGAILEKVKNTINDACGQSHPSPRFSAPEFSVPSQGLELPTDEHKDDNKFNWDDIIQEVKDMEQEEEKENIYDIFTREEYEDEDIINEQRSITLANNFPNPPVTGKGIVPSQKNVRNTPNLSIDIEKELRKGHTVYEISGKVRLEKDEKPDGSYFYMFTHESPDGQPFKVKEVKHGNNTISQESLGFSTDENIDCLAVWYWNKDTSMKNPLLIEVLKEDGYYVYSFNNGNFEWQQLSGRNSGDTSELYGEPLEKVLDNLNCRLNDAVTIDLSHSKSQERSYCCDYHKNKERISVEKKEVIVGKLKWTIYYKHQINVNINIAKIKYYPQGSSNDERKRITAKGLNFPIKGSASFYIFYCDYKPVLMYVDSYNQKKWYKRKKKDEHNWDNLAGGLDGKDPDNLKGCNDLNQIKGVLETLGCGKLKECKSQSEPTSSSILTISTRAVDPKIIIKLSEKPRKNSNPESYTDDQQIKVTRFPYPPTPLSGGTTPDFYRYTHQDKDSPGKSFKLEKIWDDQHQSVITGDKVPSATLVAAYYWKHESGPGKTFTKALLVEVINEGGNKMYYSKSTGDWKYYDLRVPHGDNPSQAELDLLNCEINDVVQINVIKTSKYCHDGHGGSYNKKVKVTDATPGENRLGNYIAYAHIPNIDAEICAFNISGFTKNNKPIIIDDLNSKLPLRSVEKVIVYFCTNRFYDPLLIYVQYSQGKQWFKKSTTSSEWVPVHELKDKTDSDYDSIVEFLDGLDSDCKPPTVTIDIYQRKQHKEPTTYGNPPSTIEVRAKELPGTTNFTEYVHTIHGRSGNYFTVKDFQYKNNKITDEFTEPIKYLTSVSVFYWTPLENPIRQDYIDKRGRPLLIKVTNKAPGILSTEKWYKNKDEVPGENYKWERVYPGLFTNLALENQLKLLNCRLNNAVVIDISKQDTVTYDACKDTNMDPQHGETSMQVTKENSTSLRNYTVYTHTLAKFSGNGLFHVLSFKNDSQDISIGDTSYSSPILDVTEVKVYMCGISPLLIYIKTSDPKFGSKKWWKYNGNKTWDKVISLAASNTTDYGNILQVLSNLPSECSVSKEGEMERSTGFEVPVVASIAGYVSSGVFAGAGSLTGFGWWAFKRSRGDPWVRQI